VQDVVLVREWDADSFHRRVLDLEAEGYEARRDSYRISPEMDPETGNIVHLHTIEMCRSRPREGNARAIYACMTAGRTDILHRRALTLWS
jgi:hypothetical protein